MSNSKFQISMEIWNLSIGNEIFHTRFFSLHHCFDSLKRITIDLVAVRISVCVFDLFFFLCPCLSFEHFSPCYFLLFLGDNLYSFDVSVSPHGVDLVAARQHEDFSVPIFNNRNEREKKKQQLRAKKQTKQQQQQQQQSSTRQWSRQPHTIVTIQLFFSSFRLELFYVALIAIFMSRGNCGHVWHFRNSNK